MEGDWHTEMCQDEEDVVEYLYERDGWHPGIWVTTQMEQKEAPKRYTEDGRLLPPS
jgi:hypothetical protein